MKASRASSAGMFAGVECRASLLDHSGPRAIGRIATRGAAAGQPMRFAINPQYNLKDDDGLEQFSVTATVTFLVPSP